MGKSQEVVYIIYKWHFIEGFFGGGGGGGWVFLLLGWYLFSPLYYL